MFVGYLCLILVEQGGYQGFSWYGSIFGLGSVGNARVPKNAGWNLRLFIIHKM